MKLPFILRYFKISWMLAKVELAHSKLEKFLKEKSFISEIASESKYFCSRKITLFILFKLYVMYIVRSLMFWRRYDDIDYIHAKKDARTYKNQSDLDEMLLEQAFNSVKNIVKTTHILAEAEALEEKEWVNTKNTDKVNECSSAKKYKAIHPPKCNNGNPCDACTEKYKNAQKNKKKTKKPVKKSVKKNTKKTTKKLIKKV